MCRYVTFARIFLTLSIINFARAAPVVVRGAHDVHVNVDGAEDKTATLQKRMESAQTVPLGSDQPWLSQLAPRPPSPESSWPSQLAPGNTHPPNQGFSWPDQLVSKTHPPNQDFSWPDQLAPKTPPSNPDSSWPSHWQLAPGSPHSPNQDFSWPDQLAPKTRPPNPDSSAGPHQVAADHPPSSPESPRPTDPETKNFISKMGTETSQDPPSPAEPKTMDLLSQLGPWQGPHPEQSQDPRPETKNFLSQMLKDRIKRHFSGSVAVNPVPDSQATMIDPTSYVFGSSPSPANLQTTPGPRKPFDCSCDLHN